uniref:protein-tyrosine-phosphatase n=1 Tax=Parascaris equorum TaxID=6256 RepID=A0A914S4Y1_PAREQ
MSRFWRSRKNVDTIAFSAVFKTSELLMAREFLISKFEENEKSKQWNAIFQSIENLSDKQERALKLSTRIAHSWQNAEKNRYRNVSAYDCSRVVLKKTNDDQSDYINASPLSIPLAKRNYILTQCLLAQYCAAVSRCHEYFASTQRPVRVFGMFEVHLRSEEQCEHYVMRTLEVVTTDDSLVSNNSKSASRSVLHFQFISWPDFGVPHCSRVFLDFLDRVRATGRLQQLAPVVVHCSAGIGRSGTFVVVDSVLSMIDEKVESIDMEELVVKMRRHPNTGRGDGPPHLERSAANQMTSGQHAKSLTDISGTIRKRSSGEQCESEEDAKYARRFVCFISFLLPYSIPIAECISRRNVAYSFLLLGAGQVFAGVVLILFFFPHNVLCPKAS